MADDLNLRRARRAGETDRPRVEQSGAAWRIRTLSAARQVLHARNATTQAGFTAEAIPKGYLRHHPILISDGPLHDEQRRKVGRFFAPTVVSQRHAARIRSRATELIEDAVARGSCRLDDLALRFSVDVTRHIVGIDHSSLDGICRRLVSFFNQPPVDLTKPDLGRTGAQWARAALNGLLPVLRFYLADVRPAVRALRKHPGDNVISHLIAEGYTNTDILVEAVTYGTAGMVTTRQFISMVCWHLLEDDTLRHRYTAAGQEERFAILEETIRLEPVVGHLYRRVQEPLDVTDEGTTWRMSPGDLVDLCVRQANTDDEAVGERPFDLCPGRALASGVDAAGLSFGSGAHQCPGRSLAITETDAFLSRLLEQHPVLLKRPTVGWDSVTEGYTLRGLELGFSAA